MNTFITNCRSERGSANVEMAIMLPIFLLILVMLLFAGNHSLTTIDVARTVGLKSSMDEVQADADIPDQYLRFEGIDNFGNGVELTTDSETLTPDDLYEAGDVGGALEEFEPAEDPYDLNDALVDAAYDPVGFYTFNNGELEYTFNEGGTWMANIIESSNMLDELDTIAETLDGWFAENVSEAVYNVQLTVPGFNESIDAEAPALEGVALHRSDKFRGTLYDDGARALGEDAFNTLLDDEGVSYADFAYPGPITEVDDEDLYETD